MTHVSTDFLKENKDALLIDCRFIMSEPEKESEAYKKEHIKGAIYVDLDKDMMGELAEHGGRHPLPDMDKFRKKMESIGVSDDRTVVLYDNGEFPSSGRLWFMLQILGKDSYIINGGYPALVEAGFETDNEIPKLEKGKITTPINKDLIVDVNYVRTIKDNPNVILVDSRSEERHLGIEEPIDKIAGRIPGTVNIFWKNCFDGSFVRPKEELEEIFKELDKYDEVVFHCGSGVTGAVNVMMYKNLGKKSKLYAGSYSDYISYKGHELIIKDNQTYIIE